MGGMMGMGGMSGFGGMANQMMQQQMQSQGMLQRQMGNMTQMSYGGGGMGQAKAAEKHGKKADIHRKEKRTQTEKQIAEEKGVSLFDPHFDIVQVKVYGQARFFSAPPAEAMAQPSQADAAADAAAAPGGPAAAKGAGAGRQGGPG